MGRPDLIYEQIVFALRFLFVVASLAALALLAPTDWRRNFGKVRTN
jgi:hypothetical protein